jgi:hypothetical protein
MSTFESWLLSNLLEISVFLIGGILAFLKLSRFQDESIKWREEFTETVEKMQVDLATHQKDPSPHSACPAHSAILQEIKGVLNLIQERISGVDTRMFTRINQLEDRIFDVLKLDATKHREGRGQ